MRQTQTEPVGKTITDVALKNDETRQDFSPREQLFLAFADDSSLESYTTSNGELHPAKHIRTGGPKEIRNSMDLAITFQHFADQCFFLRPRHRPEFPG